MKDQNGITMRFDFAAEQTVDSITKITGLVKAKYLIPMIDFLNLMANPRSSKTGPVTHAIQESIRNDANLFPFKTKGILLASSGYERLERNRIRIMPSDMEIEGILDGGHNTLAIGLYILEEALSSRGMSKVLKNEVTWDRFKESWNKYRDIIEEYANVNSESLLNFYVPIELLVPKDPNNTACVEKFKNNLLEINAARNNNVQLKTTDKANQKGYYDTLKSLLKKEDEELFKKVEWKTDAGGEINVQDIIALCLIPLSVLEIKDDSGKIIKTLENPVYLYSSKGNCLKQFDKLMESDEVTSGSSADYKRELINTSVVSALQIAVKMPKLFDYIFEYFPQYYNAQGGKYGSITAVKSENDKKKEKTTPFGGKQIETMSPSGFIMPLVYGLKAIMHIETDEKGYQYVRWINDPEKFLKDNLKKIVEQYSGIISMAEYDPQKVGKSPQSYSIAYNGYKMALNKLL